MTTTVEDPADPCHICGHNPASVFGICLRCLPRAVWFIDDVPWTD
jgi:hypothetical protein